MPNTASPGDHSGRKSFRARIGRLARRLIADPIETGRAVARAVEDALIRRDGRSSLRRLNAQREPDESIAREVKAVRWFHRITLPGGWITPGDNHTSRYARRLQLPASFAGKTVLDIGAWDGYYSFDAEQRGAARVLATDHFCWSGDGWGTRAGFDLAHRLRGSRIEARDIDIPDISAETVGVFDVVLFLGVLYHLPEPLAALQRVASVTRELLVLETMVDLTFMRQPALSFQRGRSQPRSLYRHWRMDPTTWFVPNEAAVVAMLEHVGFSRIERVYPRSQVGRRINHLANALVPLVNIQKNYRMVFHAWK